MGQRMDQFLDRLDKINAPLRHALRVDTAADKLAREPEEDEPEAVEWNADYTRRILEAARNRERFGQDHPQ